MLKYKINIVDALERIGFNLYQAKKTGLISQGTYNKLKDNDTGITLKSLNVVCSLLDLQPKDILMYVEDNEDVKNIELFNSCKKDKK